MTARVITITDAPVCNWACALEPWLMPGVLAGALLLITIAAFNAARSAMYWRDEDKW